VGEDVSELLDMIAAQLKVIEIARIKKSCRRCEKMVQEPAPSRPIPRSMAGPACWPTFWSPSSTTTFRSTARTRSSPAWAPTSLTRRWWTGAAGDEDAPSADREDRGRDHGQRLLHADDTPIRVLDRSRRTRGWARA
jgi:transposase